MRHTKYVTIYSIGKGQVAQSCDPVLYWGTRNQSIDLYVMLPLVHTSDCCTVSTALHTVCSQGSVTFFIRSIFIRKKCIRLG